MFYPLITIICPCNIHKLFSAVKIENLIRRIFIFSIFLLKTLNKKNRYTSVNPIFTIQTWGMLGYTFHGHVLMMEYSMNRIYIDP